MSKKSVKSNEKAPVKNFFYNKPIFYFLGIVLLLSAYFLFDKQSETQKYQRANIDKVSFAKEKKSKTVTTAAVNINRAADVTILLYHIIEPLAPGAIKPYAISPENFDLEMNLLAANKYNVIALSRLVEFLETGNGKLPEKAIVITFDDGTIGQYNYGLPILKKYNFPASFFIVSSWADQASAGLNGNYINWQQINEMLGNGMEIGSHTVSHDIMYTLSPEMIKYELALSKKKIESKTGREVKYFAYPTGNWDDKVMSEVKISGYTAALSTQDVTLHSTDKIFHLGRRCLYTDNNVDLFKHRMGIP